MKKKLSSRGQIVIPKELRDKLGLEQGDELQIYYEKNRLVLKPDKSRQAMEKLEGKLAGEDLVEELEQEHQSEIKRDELRS